MHGSDASSLGLSVLGRRIGDARAAAVSWRAQKAEGAERSRLGEAAASPPGVAAGRSPSGGEGGPVILGRGPRIRESRIMSSSCGASCESNVMTQHTYSW